MSEPKTNSEQPNSVLLSHLVRANMKTIAEIRASSKNSRNPQTRLADAITKFSGDMNFVYLHVVWFAIWIAINHGFTPLRAFDPFPYGLLTMIVSLEAIFLSTFVLISQNRAAAMAEERADLDLHVDLLSEHEITKILRLVDAIARKVGVTNELDEELSELEEQITPDQVLAELKRQS